MKVTRRAVGPTVIRFARSGGGGERFAPAGPLQILDVEVPVSAGERDARGFDSSSFPWQSGSPVVCVAATVVLAENPKLARAKIAVIANRIAYGSML